MTLPCLPSLPQGAPPTRPHHHPGPPTRHQGDLHTSYASGQQCSEELGREVGPKPGQGWVRARLSTGGRMGCGLGHWHSPLPCALTASNRSAACQSQTAQTTPHAPSGPQAAAPELVCPQALLLRLAHRPPIVRCPQAPPKAAPPPCRPSPSPPPPPPASAGCGHDSLLRGRCFCCLILCACVITRMRR